MIRLSIIVRENTMSKMLIVIGAILTLRAPIARPQATNDTWGFVNARYDTRSSASIYTGYGWRGAFAMAAVLHNPRSGYAELQGGVGGVFKTGADANHWLVVATAGSRDVSFAQVYWLPTIRTGVVTSRATVKWRVPYKGRDVQKLAVSPLAMTLQLGRGLAAGPAVELTAAEGARTNVGAGAELRLKLPGAAVGADAVRDVTGKGSGVRLFFTSVF
jgi:hypothetical protein